MTKNNINKLREEMDKNGIDVYYFNTSDYHQSEYVPEYFKTLAYFSGFTGSLASLLISKDDAFIFVDGRYHLQADKQCLENDIKVIKLGTKGALDPISFINTYFKDKVIGLDGKRTSIKFVEQLLKHDINIKSMDIYSDLIENRSPLSSDPLYELEDKYTGLARSKKIYLIKSLLKGDVHIVNNLEAIAYLLNLRGNDILYTPVFLAYMIIEKDDVHLFVNKDRLNETLYNNLRNDGVVIHNYEEYYDYLKTISNCNIRLDENKINYETLLCLNDTNNIFDGPSLIDNMKAIKNPVEQANMQLAHIYDGIALLRFLMWINKQDKSLLSEYTVAEKINSFRLEYKADDLSFNSIVAYNDNAAIMHYSPKKDNCAMLDNKGILLFDTGGQYKYGTTDITRTIALGEVDAKIKKYFTLVLKSMFNLSEIKFLKGLSGNQLDILARQDLWKMGVDYRHGTGHGVGYNLSVHEFPPNIRYGKTDNGSEAKQILPGMVVSDEPGVYFENEFGIRCENLLLCVADEENEYGQFLRFKTLTLVPFDLNLIDKNYLDENTIKIINNYHQRVFNTLAPYLNGEETSYLRELTKAI